ncbi:MAG: hypothetical protein WCA44_12255 [Acidobacteriaceae bacterium]
MFQEWYLADGDGGQLLPAMVALAYGDVSTEGDGPHRRQRLLNPGYPDFRTAALGGHEQRALDVVDGHAREVVRSSKRERRKQQPEEGGQLTQVRLLLVISW